MLEQLVNAITALDEEQVHRLTDEALADGADAQSILNAGREAVNRVGEQYAQGRAFIPELIMAGEIMQQVSAKVRPLLAARQTQQRQLGTIVLATVKGDIHDIGKDIVGALLEIAGFTIIDLGVDVPAAQIVTNVRAVAPVAVGLSGLLTVAFDSMKATVDAIRQADLRPCPPVMIGGAPVNEQVCRYVGADGWGGDAVAAVALAKSLTGDA